MKIVSYLQALVPVYTVTNFWFLPMLTHLFSYIVVLGPYFGCWGSLFHKIWVLIGSLSQSLGVLISFGDSEDGSTNIPLTIILISQVREAQYGGDQEEHLLHLRSWEERLWQQECDFWGEFFLTSGSKGTNVNVPLFYPGSCQQGTQHVELSLVHRLDKGDIFYRKTWFPILPLPQVKDPTEFTGPESYVHSMVKVNVNCRQLKCICPPRVLLTTYSLLRTDALTGSHACEPFPWRSTT